MATVEFGNNTFSESVKNELNARSAAVKRTKDNESHRFTLSSIQDDDNVRSWNYENRAYGKLVGSSKCGSMVIEDNYTLTSNKPYTKDGTKVVPRPVLNSIGFTNSGGSDITDAALWECTAEFTVYSLNDLDRAERVFMLPGESKIQVQFGWVGRGGTPNNGKIKGDLANFNFTADLDGSFKVSITFYGEVARGTSTTTDSPQDTEVSKDEDGNVVASTNGLITGIQRRLANMYLPTLKEDADENTNVPTGQLDGTFLRDNAAIKNSAYSGEAFFGGFVHLKQKHGFMDFDWISNQDPVIPMVSLVGLISTINKLQNSPIQLSSVATFDATSIWVGTGDPGRMILDCKTTGNYRKASIADYNVPPPIGNKGDFNYFVSEYASGVSGNEVDVADALCISTFYLQSLLEGMITTEKGDENKKIYPSIPKFLNRVFADVKQETGGYIDLALFSDPNSGSDDVIQGTKNYVIINKVESIVPPSESASPYKFSLIGENSIVKGMSYSAKMDSELTAIAYSKNTSGTQNPRGMVDNYFGALKCVSVEDEETDVPKSTLELQKDRLDAVSLSDDEITAIEDDADRRARSAVGNAAGSGTGYMSNAKREEIYNRVYADVKRTLESEKLEEKKKEVFIQTRTPKQRLVDAYNTMAIAYSTENATELKSALRQYFMEDKSSPIVNKTSIRFPIDLSVTLDGIFGVRFYDTFTIDRLPGSIRANGNIYFIVGEQQHSFSDGNWETTLTGYMMVGA